MIPFPLVVAVLIAVDVAGLAAAWWSLQRPRTPAAQSSARVAAFIARYGAAPQEQLPARSIRARSAVSPTGAARERRRGSAKSHRPRTCRCRGSH